MAEEIEPPISAFHRNVKSLDMEFGNCFGKDQLTQSLSNYS